MNNLVKQFQGKYRGFKMRFRSKYSPQVIKNKLLIVPKIYDVPPIKLTGNSDFEVHVLVSRRDFPAMLWGLYSFYSFSSHDIGLVVHDDGSLDQSHRKKLETIFPGSNLIFRSESDLRMEQELSSFPRSKKLRKTHATHLKIIDFFIFANRKKILFFDSDIIFFESPEKILKEDKEENLFIEDVGTGYVLSIQEIASSFYLKVPPKINTGFGKIRKSCLDLEFLESCLSYEKLARGLFTTEQTLIAMLAARGGGVETLGEEYKMKLEPGIEGKVIKHYVNIIRYRLYTEGIPWVYENLMQK